MGETTPAGQVLCRYVDGLELSIYGEPRSQVFEKFRAEKGALRASPRGLKRFGSISGVPGGDLMLSTEGGSRYQFVLYNGAVSRLEATSRGVLPNVMVRFRAKTLYENNFEETNAIAEAIATFFLRPGFEVKVRRFDLAVDFQCEGWVWPAIEDVDTRAKKREVYYEGGAITGMTFSKRRGPLQIVIYDKRREVDVHDKKEWMEGVWATSGAYNEQLPVIRLELRFSRALLKDFGIETVIDLRNHVGDVVWYAVGGQKPWFRVASPGRPETAPWWHHIRNACLQDLPRSGRIRVRSDSLGGDPKRARSNLATYAVQSAAWDKVQGRNPAPSLQQYLGSVSMHYLPGGPKDDVFEYFEQAVDSMASKLVASGKAF